MFHTLQKRISTIKYKSSALNNAFALAESILIPRRFLDLEKSLFNKNYKLSYILICLSITKTTTISFLNENCCYYYFFFFYTVTKSNSTKTL